MATTITQQQASSSTTQQSGGNQGNPSAGGRSGPPGGGGSGNPSGGGGGPPGGGGAPGGGQPAGGAPQQAVPQPGANGALKGTPPVTFLGKRGTAEIFLQQFQIYRNANRHNEAMANPFERTNLALTFMAGDAAKWAATYGEELFIAVNGDPANNLAPTHVDTDEALWNDFCLRLKTRFSEYHGSQSASQALVTLKQEPGHVEDYINKFDRLVAKAGWNRDAHGTIKAFQEGLAIGLLQACCQKRPPPATLQQWYDTAGEEERYYEEQKFTLQQAKGRRYGKDLARDARDATRRRQKAPKDIDPRPYHPMEVDAAKTQRLLLEERKKLIQAGKCFYCKKEGHLFRECPTRPKDAKGKKKETRRPQRPRARAAEASSSSQIEEIEDHPSDADEEGENPPAYAKKDVLAAIKAMKTADRDELIETLTMDGDSDF